MTPSLFQFQSHAVRVVQIDGKPWFVTKDVCGVLGLAPDTCGSYSRNLFTLSKEEKNVLTKTPQSDRGLFSGQAARISAISESGLYKLVMRSDKPEARKFQDWVTKEVLPALRGQGATA